VYLLYGNEIDGINYKYFLDYPPRAFRKIISPILLDRPGFDFTYSHILLLFVFWLVSLLIGIISFCISSLVRSSLMFVIICWVTLSTIWMPDLVITTEYGIPPSLVSLWPLRYPALFRWANSSSIAFLSILMGHFRSEQIECLKFYNL
jgi:hypothetical protein